MQMTKTLKRIGTRLLCDLAESFAFFALWILYGLFIRPGIALVNVVAEVLVTVRDVLAFPFSFTDEMRKVDENYDN